MTKGWRALMGALLVFPQIVETIYSPALTDIGLAFSVGPELAAQTLSCYFGAFAAGVLAWGWLSDRWGRRNAMLCGLAVYAVGAGFALLATSFTMLMMARIFSAFGAAVGSVVTQTMMRDRLEAGALSQLFSRVSLALAISPALGLMAGSALSNSIGYRGVFAALILLAVVLLAWAVAGLPETRPRDFCAPPLAETARRMAVDPRVWLAVLVIGLFNISLFSYYALGPFLLARAGLHEGALMWGGLALTTGSLLGTVFAARLRRQCVSPAIGLATGAGLALAGAIIVDRVEGSWFLIPALIPTAMAFVLVVPNILSLALVDYADCRGSAGALLGLAYYIIIAAGLAIAGWCQDLGATLLVCSFAGAICLVFWSAILSGPSPGSVSQACNS